MPEKILTAENEEALLDEEKREAKPESVLLPNGQEEEAFGISDAAIYLRMSRVGFVQMLERLEKEGTPVPMHRKVRGGRRCILRRDLDDLRRVEPVAM